jgi:hypothetical protein
MTRGANPVLLTEKQFGLRQVFVRLAIVGVLFAIVVRATESKDPQNFALWFVALTSTLTLASILRRDGRIQKRIAMIEERTRLEVEEFRRQASRLPSEGGIDGRETITNQR